MNTCGCERGGDCTPSTRCATESALEDQAEQIERLVAIETAAENFMNNHMDHDDSMTLYEALAANKVAGQETTSDLIARARKEADELLGNRQRQTLLDCANRLGRLKVEAHKGEHPREQYNRLADYVIPKKHLWTGHEGSHVDSVMRGMEELKTIIKEAIDTLENDLHVSKAENARVILQDALDVHGQPDEHGPED